MAKKQQTRKAAPSKKVVKAIKKAAAKTQPKASPKKQKQKNNQASATVKRDAPATLLSEICTDPRNPRRRAITPENDAGLQELAGSIAKFGDVLEPLIVRQRTKEELKEATFEDGGSQEPYMLISGHRRKAAAELAGIDRLHCIVWENISPAEAFEMQLVENLHRADLLPTEEASAYQRMSEELGYTHKEISLRVGRSEKHILRYLKLYNLPEKLKNKLDNGETSIQKVLFFCSLPEKTAEEVLKDGDRYFNYSWNFESFKETILRSYIEDLDGNLPFKLDGKYGKLPKCTECPHKGSHPELFAEFVKEDKCPFAECFREKQRLAEEAEEQKRKAKAKAQAAKQGAESDEDDDDTDGSKSESSWELNRKIERYVDSAKIDWYIDKLIAKHGINATDIFNKFFDDEFLSSWYDELYSKYIGKNIAELKRRGTWEEILKARIISSIGDDSYNNDEGLCEWIGCDECPDEVLVKAREEAMGISK